MVDWADEGISDLIVGTRYVSDKGRWVFLNKQEVDVVFQVFKKFMNRES